MIWVLISRWGALLVLAAPFVGILSTLSLADSAGTSAGGISFYGDFGNIIGHRNPLLVRPSMLLLAEDGSVALVHLQWTGWGTSVARGTGVWTASNCTPNCATGKLTTSPANVTLWDPGLVGGHKVYRCFQIYPPHPDRDILDRGCIRRQGKFYEYAPISLNRKTRATALVRDASSVS